MYVYGNLEKHLIMYIRNISFWKKKNKEKEGMYWHISLNFDARDNKYYFIHKWIEVAYIKVCSLGSCSCV